MKTNHPMKAIGNTLHSVARSVQRKAQALHHALPERNLINEGLQGITAQLRGHRPVETEGRMDPQMLDADPVFEDVKTALENALPEQHYNRDERGSLARNGKVGGQLLKEAIEQRMESLRHAAGTDRQRRGRRFQGAAALPGLRLHALEQPHARARGHRSGR